MCCGLGPSNNQQWISWDQPLFAKGTKVAHIGRDNLTAERRRCQRDGPLPEHRGQYTILAHVVALMTARGGNSSAEAKRPIGPKHHHVTRVHGSKQRRFTGVDVVHDSHSAERRSPPPQRRITPLLGLGCRGEEGDCDRATGGCSGKYSAEFA